MLGRLSAYTGQIDDVGQGDVTSLDTGLSPSLDVFVSRVGSLTDADRREIAEARKGVHEAFHSSALRAALELLVGREDDYMLARRALAAAHVPDGLENAGVDEVDDLNEVARYAQLAIDDGLLAALTSDALHPNHLRELHRSLKVVLGS